MIGRRLKHHVRISVKIATLYTILALLSWISIIFIFQRINYRNIRQSAETLAMQSLATMAENVDTLIDKVTYFSEIVLSDSEVTEALENKDRNEAAEALRRFVSLIDDETGINGIYIWDMDSHGCSLDRNQVRELRQENIKKVSWYDEVEARRGSRLIRINADKVLTQSSSYTSVSIIRMINSPEDFQPLGIIMINLDIKALEDCWKSLSESDIPDIYLLDDTGKIVISRAEIPLPQMAEELSMLENNRGEAVYKKQASYLAAQDIENLGWKVMVGVTLRTTPLLPGNIWVLVALVELTAFCMIGYFFMKRHVARPIERISGFMNRMSEGRFEKIDAVGENSFEELELLKSTYNDMVEEIDGLILRVYKEEKFKRKAELKALQEQMKPHFFYNTIDAMSYLALSGKNEELYDALEAFGSYYRTLLSKGKEMITVHEELCMVKDYLELQKLRYGDSLRYVINSDPELENTYILKMTVQPLVENSVNHGIRPKVTSGLVYIECIQEEGFIKMSVVDDGVGMNEKQLAEIQQEVLDTNAKSFGLRGTMERMKIFYEKDIEYEIKSHINKGTSVIFRVPILYEGDVNLD